MGAKKVVFILLAGVIMVGLKPHWLDAAEAAAEWQRIVAAAKKEGKVVIGAPPGNDFRNEVQAVLKKRFDLDSEFIQAPGPNLMSKIVAEKQAGAVSVDAFLVGPCTGNTLLKTDLFEPLTAAMILPEVSDPAKWFGGHLWADNQTGKIKKLAQQDMFVGRNARQIADALAKGNLSLTIGVGYRDFDAFLDANLPVKHLPTLKEGTYVSGGNGIVGVIKGAPHPNAAKVFFNWLLSREGQELHGKTAQQPTRRLDVDTKGLDGQAAKDVMTLDEFKRFQNFTEDKCNNSWFPGARLAEAVLK